MKRFLPFILISSVFVQLFAPFTIGVNFLNPKINYQLAFAEEGFNLNFKIDITNTDKTVKAAVSPVFDQNGTIDIKGWEEFAYMKIFKLETTLFHGDELIKKVIKERFTKEDILNLEANNLKPSTEYKIIVNVYEGAVYDSKQGKYDSYLFNPFSKKETVFTTNSEGDQTTITSTGNVTAKKQGETELMTCNITHLGGCIANIFYYLFYKPSSFIFGLAGKIMDVTLMYSLKDTSYRSPFISEGWQLARDLCNMFFIFILLYIAFLTILDAGGSKNKSSIVNVIIIGLLINFSLFATQLIVDASNILARVFYNPKIMQIGPKVDGVVQGKTGEAGEIKLSEAIVSKVDPQVLILETDNIGKLTSKTNAKGEDGDGITAGNFILVTLLASVVNIVGAMAFASISLAFVGRVIGLWLAMILSPIAFLTFTVPQFKNTSYIGWTKWWPETLSVAFMAPVFVFFMYIIVMFLEKGLGLRSLFDSNVTGLTKIVSIVLPFILIMFLINKAKKIALGMSGEIADKISGGIKTIGGLALGGAALSTGALLRSTVGRTMAKSSRGETSSQQYDLARRLDAANGNSEAMDALSKKQILMGSIGTSLGLHKLYGKVETKVTGTTTGNVTTLKRTSTDKILGGTGGLLNKKQEKVDETNKARNKWDETKKDSGAGNIPDENLSLKDIKTMKKKFKDKNKGEYETEARNGDISLRDASGEEVKDRNGNVIRGEKFYKAEIEDRVKSQYITQHNNNPQNANNLLSPNQNLTRQHRDRLEQMLNLEFNAILKTTVDHRSNEKFKETREKANSSISMLDRGVAGSNRNSYDPRNLTKLKSDKRDSIFSKIPVALITAIAAGVRAGIKGTGMSNGGAKVHGSLLKDLGSVISDSLKSAKIDINLGNKK